MDQTPRLAGALGFAEVPRWLAQLVTRADSAGLSLLLELTRRAQARKTTLELHGANAQIIGLAQFFGLDKVLHFA